MLSKFVRKDKGFTMVEMMVVLIIIAVLIGVGVKAYTGYIVNSRVAKGKAQISTMQAALDSYFAENGRYPSTLAELQNCGIVPVGETVNDDDIGDDTDVPLKGSGDSDVGNKDPWGTVFNYRKSADEQTYCLSSGKAPRGGSSFLIGQGSSGSSEQPTEGAIALPASS